MTCSCIFEELLGVSLSPWESIVVASCLLAEKQVEVEAFDEDRATRLVAAIERLEALPNFWSRELCFEVLGAAGN